MNANRRRRKFTYVATAICLLIAVVAVYRYRVHERILFNVRAWRQAQEWRNSSLWLPDYHVVLEAVPIDGIERNLSGLTWNGETRTLFSIINRPPQIAELSTDGELLRLIPLTGFEDPEAIEYIGDNQYIIADEQVQKLICVVIEAGTREMHAEGFPRFTLGLGPTGNKGLEGLAWDFGNRKLYAAKERDPIHIYEVTGFPKSPNTTMDIDVTSNLRRDAALFMADVSSLDFNGKYGHLLVLSHESRLILEIDKSGTPISSLSLVMGNGLRSPVPQAEGIAMDDMETLYLVSEPNLFYVFRKKAGD